MNRDIIKTKKAKYVYKASSIEHGDVTAVDDVTVEFHEGSFTAVLGRNGSGKSTFARLLNALLIPVEGVVFVDNIETGQEDYIWDIRRNVGIIFQNPDNQIVGTTVEEDVAFGPENLGIPPMEIRQRVDAAIETVDMGSFVKNAPHLLSGGQKQRVAIAGILSMKPKCIVTDEATSMLDPIGRKEVIKVLKRLNEEEKITIIHITHHMEEAAIADRVIIFDKGKLVLDGCPKEVFSRVKIIKQLGLEVPQVTELFYDINMEGFDLPLSVIDIDEAYKAIVKRLK